jgi:class 3 adenylate cyclase
LVPTETGREFLSTIGSVSNTEEESDKAVLYTALVASVFFLLLSCFLVYDWLMEKRQSVVSNIATKSSAIVENLFPAQVRDRMLQGVKHGQQRDDQEKPIENGISKNSLPAVPGGAPGPVSVKQFLSNDDGMNNNISGQPIADLFPNTTVLFADIAGFTAWSSQRDPPQVFTLLETLYRSFDVIAKKLKVFKGSYLVCREVTQVIVGTLMFQPFSPMLFFQSSPFLLLVETIGDCYMAVTGLPNPDDAHAVHMARFAYQCLVGMKDLTRELEAMLGPGTSELALRVGLHSGPVTAGVLRGEKSRFQLFGGEYRTLFGRLLPFGAWL